MDQPYNRLASEARIEFTEQRSRFIGLGRPVADESEALAYLEAVKNEFPDARHHVYAYTLSRDQFLQRFSDDGEPSGTAGAPVLNILQRNGLSQSILVVVRYFGGILLGTGGLTRAYGSAAALCVQAAGIVRMLPCLNYQVVLSYADYDALTRLVTKFGARITATGFGLDVDIEISVPLEQAEDFLFQVSEISRGSALVEEKGRGYLAEPAKVQSAE